MSIEKPIVGKNIETNERFGRNVTLVIDLLRHPEKDYTTGNLTEEGKQAFVTKLQEEYEDPDNSFDTVKAYVSPLKRGQQSMEPIGQFLEENGITSKIRTRQELLAGMEAYGTETDRAVDAIVQERHGYAATSKTGDAFEPVSKDEEVLKNEILIREFFDKNFPAMESKGEDFGNNLDQFIQHLAQMAERFYSGSRVKIINISHSGIIEYLTKLIYLKNHPEKKADEVDVEEIGGLLDYMSGPRITISSDAKGKQKARFEYRDLILEYALD